jgi:hypothetical protein
LRTGVAGSYQDFIDLRRLRALPCEGVLAAAAADDQNFHRVLRLVS